MPDPDPNAERLIWCTPHDCPPGDCFDLHHPRAPAVEAEAEDPDA